MTSTAVIVDGYGVIVDEYGVIWLGKGDRRHSYITPLKPKELLLPTLEMLVGEAYRLPRTGPGLKKTELSWSTSDEGVVFVSDRGLLTAKSPGTAKLIVTTENGRQVSIDVQVLAE